MNRKDIKTRVEDVKNACERYLMEITQIGNECAYTDRIVEEIILNSEKLKIDYESQFSTLTIADAWMCQLSSRTANCLKRAYIFSIEDLTSKSIEEIKMIPNFTMKNVNEILSFLEKNGLTLKE